MADEQRLERTDFLGRHNISVSDFESTGLKWETLEEIFLRYLSTVGELETTANYISGRLRVLPSVHSLKLRIKHPEHLLEKIIRKKREKPEIDVTPDNYSEIITDLIGIRVLHLFKEQWQDIHTFVTTTWDLHENPTAYIREGDSDPILEIFRKHNCCVQEHPFGYRSVHYLVKSQPAKQLYLIELQVRTIFEEGWSEIDHQIRYPQHSSNPFLSDFLQIFNRLAGSADEMGSYIKALSQHVREQDARLVALQENFDKTISELNISKAEKEKLQSQVNELRKSAQTRNRLLINPHLLPQGPSDLKLKMTTFPELKMPTIPTPGSILEKFWPASDHTCARCGKPFKTEFPNLPQMICPDCRKPGFTVG